MSVDKPTKRWEPEDIDRMLAMLPVIEEEGFVSHTWGGGEKTIVQGRESTQMLYPMYHPVIDILWKECYDSSAYIHPYERLPEDRVTGEEGHIGLEVFPTVESFALGTLDQIRRYLVLLMRGEPFSWASSQMNSIPAAFSPTSIASENSAKQCQ